MKKRIGSFLLALVLTFLLIPSLAVDASAAAIDESYNTGAGKGGGGGALTSSIFSSAVVQNTSASGSGSGTAKSLEVEVKLKAFSSKNSVYALVMKASDYSAFVQTAGGPQSAGIDGTTYFQQSKFDIKYYAIGRKNPGSGTAGGIISLPLVVASTENASALGADKPVSNKTMPVATVTSDNYFDEYVLVVFSTEVASDDNYYVDRFYVDADGYVRTPSYLIRYNANNPVGTGSVNGTPARTIVRALPGGVLAGSTTLSAANPARMGYTFLGWSKTAKTASADLTGSDTDYTADVSYPKPGTLYTVNNLHAVWKTIPVAFATVEGSKNQTVADQVRVGVTLSQTFSLDDTVSGGTKNYRVTQVTVDGGAPSDPTKFPNNIPAGLEIDPSGAKQWILSGTPAYDCDKPIVMTVKVTDQSNTTVDTMELTIPKIEKGLQLPPDTTVTTGLSTTMVDENDGRLIGFYAAGQPEKADSADKIMTDGTGTYTNYYLEKGMVYEYRPKTAKDTGAWREIPAPKGLYDVSAADWAGFEASLSAGATTRYKTTISSKTTASYAAITEGGSGTAWDTAYGAIIFDETSGLPVVTSLAKDAEYEIRFRGNDTFDASPAATITVGGAAASSGPSGYSLIFNLMGGAVTWMAADEGEGWNPPEDGTQPQNPYAVPITVTAAGNITIPALPDHAELTKTDCVFGGFTDGQGNTYQPGDAFPMSAMSVGLAAIWTSSKVDLSGARTVTFVDWDNSTQLAVTAVNKGEMLEPTAYAALMNTLVNENAGTFTGLTYTADGTNEGYIFNPNRLPSDEPGYVHKPLLTDKGGYTFVGWVPGSADKCHFAKGEVPEGLLIDLATYKVEDYVTLKACYEANSKGGDANVYAQRQYSFYYETIARTANNYIIELTVSRAYDPNTGKFPARACEPVLLTRMAAGGEVLLSTVLNNQDECRVKFTFPNSFNSVVFDIGDMYGQSQVSNAVQYTVSMVVDDSGIAGANYAKIGTTDFINSGCAQTPAATINNISGGVGAAHFNTILPNGLGTLAQRRQRILYAWRGVNQWEKNNSPGDSGTLTKMLTIDQMVAAVRQEKNAFLIERICFTDTDFAQNKIGGNFSPLTLVTNVPSTITGQVPVITEVSGWKAYWSSDGLKKGDEITTATWDDANSLLTIASGTPKGSNDRFILLCAVSGGEEMACSAVVPVWDMSQE